MSNLESYEWAEKFLPRNVDSLVLNEDVDVNRIEGSNRFWYRRECHEGKEFVYINAEQDTRSPAKTEQVLLDVMLASIDPSRVIHYKSSPVTGKPQFDRRAPLYQIVPDNGTQQDLRSR